MNLVAFFLHVILYKHAFPPLSLTLHSLLSSSTVDTMALDPHSTVIVVDPSQEAIKLELIPLIRVYEDGTWERLSGTEVTPAGFDPATGVTSKDVTIHSDHPISARLYLPDTKLSRLPVLVYYHGGGFIIETTASPRYHTYMNDLASSAGVLIVSIEYRRVPEDWLPVAFDDSLFGTEWVASGVDEWVKERGDLKRLFLGGDSAGGTIAHQIVVRCQSRGLGLGIEGMLLMDPYFWGSLPVGSETTDPSERHYYEMIWRFSCPERSDVDDPWINPLKDGAAALAESLRSCARVFLCGASEDLLVERGRAYYEMLIGSQWGGKAERVVSEGEGHVFHIIDPTCEKAKELMKKVKDFINRDALVADVASSS